MLGGDHVYAKMDREPAAWPGGRFALGDCLGVQPLGRLSPDTNAALSLQTCRIENPDVSRAGSRFARKPQPFFTTPKLRKTIVLDVAKGQFENIVFGIPEPCCTPLPLVTNVVSRRNAGVWLEHLLPPGRFPPPGKGQPRQSLDSGPFVARTHAEGRGRYVSVSPRRESCNLRIRAPSFVRMNPSRERMKNTYSELRIASWKNSFLFNMASTYVRVRGTILL